MTRLAPSRRFPMMIIPKGSAGAGDAGCLSTYEFQNPAHPYGRGLAPLAEVEALPKTACAPSR
jgi:hypothetical protein